MNRLKKKPKKLTMRQVTAIIRIARENFLQSPLEVMILRAIRNAGEKGLSDAALDYIFGKQVLSPQREKIFSRFQIIEGK